MGNSCVHSYSDQNILLYGLSVCFYFPKSQKAIKESENSQIIQGLIKDSKVENWLELEGIRSKDDKVTLFKESFKEFQNAERYKK